MKMILLATDGSEPSLHAAKFLSQLPHHEAIELIVVSVLHVPGSEKTFLVGDWIETRLAQQRRNADEAYARIKTMFAGDKVHLSRMVREGHPGETLVATAKELRPELMVIGATGHSAIARKLLGSTSDYIVTHAPCSVLVARPPQVIGSKHPLRVAFELEDSDPVKTAIEEHIEIDRGTNQKIRRVTASSVNRDPAFLKMTSLQDRFHKATQPLCDAGLVVQPHFVQHGHTGKGLVRYATDHDCDVFAVGDTSKTRFRGIKIGSKTRFVLQHAPCSVLITKNRMNCRLKGNRKPKTNTTL